MFKCFFQKALRILGAGKLLPKVVQPEAGVNTLQENAARLRVSFQDQDALRTCVSCAESGPHSRRSAPNDDNIVFPFHPSKHGIIFQQVGQGLRIRDIVDTYNINFGIIDAASYKIAADAAEAVNTNSD